LEITIATDFIVCQAKSDHNILCSFREISNSGFGNNKLPGPFHLELQRKKMYSYPIYCFFLLTSTISCARFKNVRDSGLFSRLMTGFNIHSPFLKGLFRDRPFSIGTILAPFLPVQAPKQRCNQLILNIYLLFQYIIPKSENPYPFELTGFPLLGK